MRRLPPVQAPQSPPTPIFSSMAPPVPSPFFFPFSLVFTQKFSPKQGLPSILFPGCPSLAPIIRNFASFLPNCSLVFPPFPCPLPCPRILYRRFRLGLCYRYPPILLEYVKSFKEEKSPDCMLLRSGGSSLSRWACGFFLPTGTIYANFNCRIHFLIYKTKIYPHSCCPGIW